MNRNAAQSPFFLFCPECFGAKQEKGRCIFWSVTQDSASLVLGYYRAIPPGTPDGSHALLSSGSAPTLNYTPTRTGAMSILSFYRASSPAGRGGSAGRARGLH